MTDSKLTIVLDMDEVLIHTYNLVMMEHVKGVYLVMVKKKVPKKIPLKVLGRFLKKRTADNVKEYQIKFIKRPGLDNFLQQLTLLDANIVFWTASEQFYADTILNHILPTELQSCKRMYRKDCSVSMVNERKVYQKDLTRQFSSQELEKLVIVDDNSYNFQTSPKNGILAVKWEGSVVDEPQSYMESLGNGLKQLTNEWEDVVEGIRSVQADLDFIVNQKQAIRPKAVSKFPFGGFYKVPQIQVAK